MVITPVLGFILGTVVPLGLVTVIVTFPPGPAVGVTTPPILSLSSTLGVVCVLVLGVTVGLSGVTVKLADPTLTTTVSVLQLLLGFKLSHSL